MCWNSQRQAMQQPGMWIGSMLHLSSVQLLAGCQGIACVVWCKFCYFFSMLTPCKPLFAAHAPVLHRLLHELLPAALNTQSGAAVHCSAMCRLHELYCNCCAALVRQAGVQLCGCRSMVLRHCGWADLLTWGQPCGGAQRHESREHTDARCEKQC